MRNGRFLGQCRGTHLAFSNIHAYTNIIKSSLSFPTLAFFFLDYLKNFRSLWIYSTPTATVASELTSGGYLLSVFFFELICITSVRAVATCRYLFLGETTAPTTDAH